MTLNNFIGENRDELISRCRTKVAKRSAPPPTESEIDHGVPMFLNQLCEELLHGPSKTHEISKSAIENGRSLLLQQFTAFEVLQTGNVGVAGSTGEVVNRSLKAIRALIDEPAQRDRPTVN